MNASHHQQSPSATTLPNCLVIGPQRAGTTWIHQYLENHQDVVVPRGVKETFFFDRRYHRGIAWYARHFRPTRDRTAGRISRQRIVEVAPSYFHQPELPSRVLQHLGQIPLVCTLRNPAERSFSLFLLLQSYGLTKADFRTAARQHPEILETSRYRTHVARWLELFGRERMLFMFQEALATNPQEYAQQICDYLEIPRAPIDASLARPVNRPSVPRSGHLARIGLFASEVARSLGAYGAVSLAKRIGLKTLFYGKPGGQELPRLSEDDRHWILDQIADEIDGLEELIQVDLSHWKTAPRATRAA